MYIYPSAGPITVTDKVVTLDRTGRYGHLKIGRSQEFFGGFAERRSDQLAG